MQLTNIHFLSIILFIIIAFWWSILLYLFFRKREKIKQKYFLLFHQSKFYYVKYIFLLLSLIIISVWLFWIKYWEKWEKQKVNWVDIAFVLDVSKSMNALDFKDWWYNVSRLDFSKALIADYIWKNPENRYWLVIFAWDAISSSPLTTDHSTFLTFLQNVDYKNLNKQWTNLEKAVELWVGRLFSQKDEDNRAKVLVLLSDWWDSDTQVDFDYISQQVKWKNIASFVVWIWKKSGARIPNWQDFVWNIVYQKYKWKYVITKLNSSLLKKLSSSVNWDYIKADTVSDLKTVQKAISSLEKKAIEVAGGTNKKDWWRVLGVISLVLFLIYLFLCFWGNCKGLKTLARNRK